MALNKTALKAELVAIFSNLDPTKTPAQVAELMADAIDRFVKTGSIKTGTLSSTGTGNMGLPVDSTNNTGGEIE